MNLINKFKKMFSPLEIISLVLAVSVSLTLLIPYFSSSTVTPPKEVQYVVASSSLYSVDGGSPVDIFDTNFFVIYEGNNESEKKEIENILNEHLISHHILFDRHNYYFAEAPANPRYPTSEEKETLPRIINLRYINEHKNVEHEIAKPLYDLLTFGKQKSLDTSSEIYKNAFSLFIGAIYDFWGVHSGTATESNDPLNNSERKAELERLASFIPLTEEEINQTLVLREANNKYYVQFNEFNGSGNDLSISVGAIGKGMVTDVIAAKLQEKKLTKAIINGGQSSYTFLSPQFNGEDFLLKMAPIVNNEEVLYSYKLSRKGPYQMATSGIYQGLRFEHEGKEIIRSHIVDPRSGYPAQQNHEIANVVTSELSGAELDYLTTALIVLNDEDGLRLINEKYGDKDVNIAYVGKDNEGYYVAHNNGYPGGQGAQFSVDDFFRDKIIDFL